MAGLGRTWSDSAGLTHPQRKMRRLVFPGPPIHNLLFLQLANKNFFATFQWCVYLLSLARFDGQSGLAGALPLS